MLLQYFIIVCLLSIYCTGAFFCFLKKLNRSSLVCSAASLLVLIVSSLSILSQSYYRLPLKKSERILKSGDILKKNVDADSRIHTLKFVTALESGWKMNYGFNVATCLVRTKNNTYESPIRNGIETADRLSKMPYFEKIRTFPLPRVEFWRLSSHLTNDIMVYDLRFSFDIKITPPEKIEEIIIKKGLHDDSELRVHEISLFGNSF